MRMSYEAKQQADDIEDIILPLDGLRPEDLVDVKAKIDRIYELGFQAGVASVDPGD